VVTYANRQKATAITETMGRTFGSRWRLAWLAVYRPCEKIMSLLAMTHTGHPPKISTSFNCVKYAIKMYKHDVTLLEKASASFVPSN